MTRYLLDTNVLSDLVRHPQGRIAARIRAVGEAQVCTSIIVAAELRYGAAKKGSPRLADQLAAVLGSMSILPVDAPADEVYGAVRSALEKAGKPIGSNDLLIASQAIAQGLIVVTDNVGEFGRIKALQVENWLRASEPSAST